MGRGWVLGWESIFISDKEQVRCPGEHDAASALESWWSVACSANLELRGGLGIGQISKHVLSFSCPYSILDPQPFALSHSPPWLIDSWQDCGILPTDAYQLVAKCLLPPPNWDETLYHWCGIWLLMQVQKGWGDAPQKYRGLRSLRGELQPMRCRAWEETS